MARILEGQKLSYRLKIGLAMAIRTGISPLTRERIAKKISSLEVSSIWDILL